MKKNKLYDNPWFHLGFGIHFGTGVSWFFPFRGNNPLYAQGSVVLFVSTPSWIVEFIRETK